MSQKRKRSVSPSAPHGDESTPKIFRSSKIEDRQSTFLALFSPSSTPKDLQNLAEIKSASHKILAWRRESNQQSLTAARQYVTGHDDDGEKYGGKKVEQVLVNTRVTGACVVARWYGGVMLGRVRFDHMEACALEAVKKWQETVAEERLKKRKMEEEAVEKARVVKILSARDQSITVLRALAVEKEEILNKSQEAGSDRNDIDTPTDPRSQSDGKAMPHIQSDTSSKGPDYDSMPLARLRSLEKARDATLSFLLKRIDKAEADLKSIKLSPSQQGPP